METMTLKQQKIFNSIPKSWQKPLEDICKNPVIDSLAGYLEERESSGAKNFPENKNVFAALRETPFDKVSVVIVGQDPYHGAGQAHGLCFSVQPGVKMPPSLRNIFKELHSDIGTIKPSTGTLTGWAKQGVLLLNAILTVEEGKPASHAACGWELFTDAIIEQLLKQKNPMVLILWGAYAQKKVQKLAEYIDPEIHLILKSAHPSPLSAKGFLGCRHFSKTNTFLRQHNLPEINWSDL